MRHQTRRPFVQKIDYRRISAKPLSEPIKLIFKWTQGRKIICEIWIKIEQHFHKKMSRLQNGS